MPSTRPALEILEDRTAPATWGNAWPDGAHLTFSLAPDGTSVGSRLSDLHDRLDSVAPSAAWQREVLRAFQTWAVQANLNLGLVSDSGDNFGAAGRPQGDDRFGDIRLGGYAMSREVMALGSPFDAAAGTWGGDIKLNTDYAYGVGQGEVDLYTALLHEIGHALGLEHNDSDPGSVMAEGYGGIRTGLSASDIANIRALYGARGADDFEGSRGNNTQATAAALSLLSHTDGALGVRIEGDLTTTADVDYFKISIPLNLTTAVVTLSTSGLSLLQGKVTVYDSWGRVVGSAAATQPGQDLRINLTKLGILQTYYVKVEDVAGGAFGIGSYQLQATMHPLLSQVFSGVNQTVAMVGDVVNDLHTDDTMLTAGLLPLNLAQTDTRFDYAFKGNLRDSWDVDYYRIQAPTAAAGASNVLSVMVWGADNNGLLPEVKVFDARGQAVAAQTLVNENGVFTVQVENATSGASYFVKVEAQGRERNVGRYFLGIDFSSRAVQLETITHHAMTTTTSGGVIHVNRPKLFHFVFTPKSATAAAVTFSIIDRQGNVLHRQTAQSGETVTATLTLGVGDYLLKFSTAGTPPRDLIVLLQGLVLDDPIGPQGEDTTGASFTGSNNQSPPGGGQTSNQQQQPSYTYKPADESTTSNDWWYYQQTNSGPGTEDPYSGSSTGGPSSNSPPPGY